MPLRAEHFTTPIKLVLPGIIISVIGLFASNYIFNNPEKNRAKATYATWKVVNQFETMLEKNSESLPCQAGLSDQIQMKKDYAHLIEMTKQNLTDLKDEERIDKRLSAILNLKIDSYNELKKITETFLDSANSTNIKDSKGLLAQGEKNAIISRMQLSYLTDLTHIIYRDTTMIKNIVAELNQAYSSYVDSFLVEEKIQTYAEMKKIILGKWLTVDKVTIDIKPGGSGHWKQEGFESDFTWTMVESVLKIKLKDGREIPLTILRVTDAVLSFALTDNSGNEIISSACRN